MTDFVRIFAKVLQNLKKEVFYVSLLSLFGSA